MQPRLAHHERMGWHRRWPRIYATLTAAPILLDNDANVIVLAERRGQRDRFDDMLLIKASTGLGAGIVAGGVLQRGAVGAAGEFGHTKMPAAAGIACRCGDTGCLEAIAGGWALVRTMQQQGHSVGTSATSSTSPSAATPKRGG